MEQDSYLLVLLEANPKIAKIVKQCEEYKYSSAYNRINNIPDKLISKLPIDISNDWSKYINDKENKTDIDYIRNSIERQSPLGDELWKLNMVKKHGLESTLNPIGRPRRKDEI